MEYAKLCDSEYRFMQVVWEHAPIGSGQLVKLCEARLGWKKSTTYTVLKKLVEKGYLHNDHALVTVLVPQERAEREESVYFVERTFGGSLPHFLAAFLGDKQLSPQEAEAIEEMIREHREADRK
ncbi:MAG: BlaI/MecI/CopY family transcriptional regulator [Acetatifactor sp.]|nr:BlaI/MecI/CopY family transcriptional regulator [Acetatifactor sp.]